jgi:hypothetical protein
MGRRMENAQHIARPHFLSYGTTELYSTMIDAYRTLGRPSLAAVVSGRVRIGHVR